MSTDLERFIDSDGRADAVARVRAEIDAKGITYIYYQFVSVTGRIMGKGVPADHWERIADRGFQLVYGSTANLFTDRHGNYIGYGPEAWELVGPAGRGHVLPAAVGPEDGAGVLHAVPQPRGGDRPGRVPDLRLPRQPAPDPRGVRGRDRAAPAGGYRAGDDVAQAQPGRHAVGGRQDQAVLLPHRPVRRAAAADPQGDGVRQGDGPGHDPGRPRGRSRAAGAELAVRPGRPDRGPAHHLPADLPAGRPRTRRVPVLHAQAVHGRVGQRLPPQHLAVAGRGEHVPARYRQPAAAQQAGAERDRRHPGAPGRAHLHHRADGQLVPAFLGYRLLGAAVRRLGVPEPDHGAAGQRPGPVRVPVRGLRGEPLPVLRRGDQGHGRRHPAQPGPRTAGGPQHLRGHRGRQAGQEGPDDARRGAGQRWPRTM